MHLVLETFRVDLVDVLGAGWSRGEPTIGGRCLDAADRRTVAGGMIENPHDFFTGEFIELEIGRSEFSKTGALRCIRGRLDTIGKWFAEIARRPSMKATEPQG